MFIFVESFKLGSNKSKLIWYYTRDSLFDWPVTACQNIYIKFNSSFFYLISQLGVIELNTKILADVNIIEH
jgi:hypothetical protein